MLQTRFCERFGVAAPIVVAPMGPDLTGPELVAAGFQCRRLWNFASTIVLASVAKRSDHISAHPNRQALWRELRSPLPASCRHSGLHRRTSCGLIVLLGRSF